MSDKVPLVGKLDTIYVIASDSASVPAKLIVTSVCSVAATSVWAVATGASLTAVIARLTVAASESTVPSLTLKVKLSLVAVFEVLI